MKQHWTLLAYREHCLHPLTPHIPSDLLLVSQTSATASVDFAGLEMNESSRGSQQLLGDPGLITGVSSLLLLCSCSSKTPLQVISTPLTQTWVHVFVCTRFVALYLPFQGSNEATFTAGFKSTRVSTLW